MSNAPNHDPEGNGDSFERWLGEQQRQAQKRQQIAEKEIIYLCGALRFFGVEKVSQEWDGFGDDGQFEASVFHPPLPSDLPFGLGDAIDLLWHPFFPPGCEINVGWFGTLTLDVATGKVAVHLEWRDEDDEPAEEMD